MKHLRAFYLFTVTGSLLPAAGPLLPPATPPVVQEDDQERYSFNHVLQTVRPLIQERDLVIERQQTILREQQYELLQARRMQLVAPAAVVAGAGCLYGSMQIARVIAHRLHTATPTRGLPGLPSVTAEEASGMVGRISSWATTNIDPWRTASILAAAVGSVLLYRKLNRWAHDVCRAERDHALQDGYDNIKKLLDDDKKERDRDTAAYREAFNALTERIQRVAQADHDGLARAEERVAEAQGVMEGLRDNAADLRARVARTTEEQLAINALILRIRTDLAHTRGIPATAPTPLRHDSLILSPAGAASTAAPMASSGKKGMGHALYKRWKRTKRYFGI